MSFSAFQKIALHPVKFPLFLLSKLPIAYLSGVRPRQLTPELAVVSVPYKWLSQNPFKSSYFACLAMAAEMSTGLLAMGHSYQSSPAISMLVVKMEAQYFKKATERIYFTCTNGQAIQAAIEQSIQTNQGQNIEAISIGKNKLGDVVATFAISWSFKPKNMGLQ